jgi:hypothetical protein
VATQIHENVSSALAREEARRENRGRIYFISTDSETAPIKIGFTCKAPTERARQLQTGNHENLLVIAEFEGDQSTERRLHKFFSSSRLNGEWFRRDEALMSAIKLLQAVAA